MMQRREREFVPTTPSIGIVSNESVESGRYNGPDLDIQLQSQTLEQTETETEESDGSRSLFSRKFGGPLTSQLRASPLAAR
jgi:hypothetical protein